MKLLKILAENFKQLGFKSLIVPKSTALSRKKERKKKVWRYSLY